MFLKIIIYIFFLSFTCPFYSFTSEYKAEPLKNNVQSQSTEQALEQNLATLGGEPSSIVNGCVNAISGTFVDAAIDICAPGPDPLVVERVYTSTKGWNINDPERIEVQDEKGNVVTHTQKGMVTTYVKSGDKHAIRVENYRQGLTNCSSDFISGKNNPHNLKIKLKNPGLLIGSNKGTMQDGSKSIKEFNLRHVLQPSLKEKHYRSGLSYEQKPQG